MSYFLAFLLVIVFVFVLYLYLALAEKILRSNSNEADEARRGRAGGGSIIVIRRQKMRKMLERPVSNWVKIADDWATAIVVVAVYAILFALLA